MAVVRPDVLAAALPAWRTPPRGAAIMGGAPVFAIAAARAAAAPPAVFLSVWPFAVPAGEAQWLAAPLAPLVAPALVRFLASALAAVGGLAGTAALASLAVAPPAAGVVRTVEIVALLPGEICLLAILSAILVALPLDMLLLAGLSAVAAADARWRFPELTRAAAARTALATELAGAPTSLLVAAVAAAGAGGIDGPSPLLSVLRRPVASLNSTALRLSSSPPPPPPPFLGIRNIICVGVSGEMF